MKSLKVGIVGVGKSNVGVIRYLRSKGLHFSLTVRSGKQLDRTVISELNADRAMVGERELLDIDEDILFLSPTARRDGKELRAARERGVILSSDAELFYEKHREEKIAVSGSDGKSSCTYLISSILKRYGTDAYPCGNYGIPLSTVIESSGISVVELSSFQLNFFSPKNSRVLLTNIKPNHLDWHKSLGEYISAKRNLLTGAKKITVDFDSPLAMNACEGLPLFCAVSEKYSFGALRALADAENYVTLKGSTVFLNGYPYFSTERAGRNESYAIKNYMLAAGTLTGICDAEAITEAVEAFRGLPHRAELIREIDGIRYYDSSIDSTPERMLKTLSGIKPPLCVIICGKGKGLSFERAAMELPSLTAGAVLMGEVGDELEKGISALGSSYTYKRAKNMTEAVNMASKLVTGGGAVVLSPAGTSFDAYKNFEERGDDFKKAVLSLK